MKRKVMFLCLLSLSVVSMIKLSLSLTQTPEVQQVQSRAETNHALNQVVPKDTLFLKSGQWLMQELVPLAKAAKAIALVEERENMNQKSVGQEIREKLVALEQQEQALLEREQLVKSAEQRAQEKIAALEALEARIQSLLQQEESIKNRKIKRLTSVYEGMKADKAAPVIAQMDLDIVVKMFLRMNEKQVGKILSFLPPQQAVVISQALTQRIAANAP